MLDAMMSAKGGDDVFGEDETVSNLEHKLAAMFNMEAGLILPVGHYDQPDCDQVLY
jgi:threonine aldolase